MPTVCKFCIDLLCKVEGSPNITTPINRGRVGECWRVLRMPGGVASAMVQKLALARFWPMPPRRPLMCGKGGAGHFGQCEPRLRGRTRWVQLKLKTRPRNLRKLNSFPLSFSNHSSPFRNFVQHWNARIPKFSQRIFDPQWWFS